MLRPAIRSELWNDAGRKLRTDKARLALRCAAFCQTRELDAEDQHRATEPVTGEPTAWSAQDHTEEYVQQGYITEQPVEDVVSRK